MGKCRSIAYNTDSGRKWFWGDWYCTVSPENCPSGTRGYNDPHQTSDNKKRTNDSYCFGDVETIFGNDYVNRERVKCRWTIDKYNLERLNDNYVIPCCKGTKNGTRDPECHPDFCARDHDSDCPSWFLTYCNRSDRAFNSDCYPMGSIYRDEYDIILRDQCTPDKLSYQACREWCSRNNENKKICADRAGEYCTADKMNTEFCRNAAREYSKLTPKFDASASIYCTIHPNDSFCSCQRIISKGSAYGGDNEELKAILSRPDCYSTECNSDQAYMSYNLRNLSSDCPPVNICQNTIDIIDNPNVNVKDLEQGCDQQINPTPKPPIPQPPKDNNSSWIYNEFTSLYRTELLFILFVFIVVLSVVTSYNYSWDTRLNNNL
jgi:hypothetical protein